ncbi:YbaK/EbsC family protein [Rhizohabitans arisaemae]|uniref:YbaK/EbsC family protein n=1 Tax=Rhizohabitans arisaemae TaxID=2720610 RepID=UPI0024B1B0EF|nr:YbaK/EbsC family protein [Rhizohabitans arisaemae]
MGLGTLEWTPAVTRADLLAEPVAKAVHDAGILVAEIDPDLADTAAFCERYSVGLDVSANCVVVAGKRGGELRYAACLVLADSRADVNGVIRRELEVRKASFAPRADAVRLTGMEYGGITPLGLPPDWPVFVDAEVAKADELVIGSGLRRSKLAVSGALLAALPSATVVPLTLPID